MEKVKNAYFGKKTNIKNNECCRDEDWELLFSLSLEEQEHPGALMRRLKVRKPVKGYTFFFPPHLGNYHCRKPLRLTAKRRLK